MNIEFTDRKRAIVTGINDLEPGRVFLWSGICHIVTDDGDAVNPVSGSVYGATYFKNQEVEPIPADDVTMVIRR